jgi:DNA-binding NtrC family response regulator
VVAATNRDLETDVQQGRFREDLLYRLNVIEIVVPALRDRAEDILVLARRFLNFYARAFGRPIPTLSPPAEQALVQYGWPGNVRELRNTLEHAVVVCESGLVETRHLPPGFGQSVRPVVNDPDAVHLGVGTTIGEAEKLLILKTLQSTNNNKTRAAEILGISLKTLHNKLKEYGRPQDALATAEE